MQSLGLLGSGTFFEEIVCKKDGLHLVGCSYSGGIILLQGLDAFIFQNGKAIVHGRLQKYKWYIKSGWNNENAVIPGFKMIEYN